MKLDMLLDEYIDETTKGFPAGGKRQRLRDIGSMGWNVLHGDVPYPVAVLSESALAHNSHWMRNLIGKFGGFISPHGKTTMAPQLFDRQIADGAWGITVATVQQLAVCCRFGVSRVLLANQVLGAAELRGISRLLAEHPDLDLYLLVDSIEGVERLATTSAEASPGRPLKLLVEVGVWGGRTGCRDLGDAVSLARAIHGQSGPARATWRRGIRRNPGRTGWERHRA
jgi:D-serine dehydratase